MNMYMAKKWPEMVVQQSFIENFISNQSLVTFSYYAIQVMWFFINRLEVAQKKTSQIPVVISCNLEGII